MLTRKWESTIIQPDMKLCYIRINNYVHIIYFENRDV